MKNEDFPVVVPIPIAKYIRFSCGIIQLPYQNPSELVDMGYCTAKVRNGLSDKRRDVVNRINKLFLSIFCIFEPADSSSV